MSLALRTLLATSLALVLSSTSFAQLRSNTFVLEENTAGFQSIQTTGTSDNFVLGAEKQKDEKKSSGGGGRRKAVTLRHSNARQATHDNSTALYDAATPAPPETLHGAAPERWIVEPEIIKPEVEVAVTRPVRTPAYTHTPRTHKKAMPHHLQAMVQKGYKLIKTYDPYPLLSGELQPETTYDVQIVDRRLQEVVAFEVMTNQDGFFLAASPVFLPKETYRWRFTNRNTQNHQDYWIKVMTNPKYQAPSFTFELGTIWQHEDMQLHGIAMPHTTIMAYYDAQKPPLIAESNKRGEFRIVIPKDMPVGNHFLRVTSAAREYDKHYHLPSHALYRMTIATTPHIRTITQSHWAAWDIPPVLYPLASIAPSTTMHAAAQRQTHHTNDTSIAPTTAQQQATVWSWFTSLFSA